MGQNFYSTGSAPGWGGGMTSYTLTKPEADVAAAQMAVGPQYTWERPGFFGGFTHGPPVSMYIADQRQARFDKLFPYLTKALTGGAGGIGTVGTPPTISAGPVWNPQQIQQQVNSARANTDTQVASQGRQAQQQTAGRGFGSSSPLLSALQGNFQMQGMAQKEAAGREIPFQAAQANAKQLLDSQNARSGQFVTLEKIKSDQISALLQALAGIG
jgi:hypothetical protein